MKLHTDARGHLKLLEEESAWLQTGITACEIPMLHVRPDLLRPAVSVVHSRGIR